MHEDAIPGEINNIITYIALKKYNGKVFSIQRSYPMNYDGVSPHIITMIIFFVGENIAKDYLRTF